MGQIQRNFCKRSRRGSNHHLQKGIKTGATAIHIGCFCKHFTGQPAESCGIARHQRQRKRDGFAADDDDQRSVVGATASKWAWRSCQWPGPLRTPDTSIRAIVLSQEQEQQQEKHRRGGFGGNSAVWLSRFWEEQPLDSAPYSILAIQSTEFLRLDTAANRTHKQHDSNRRGRPCR